MHSISVMSAPLSTPSDSDQVAIPVATNLILALLSLFFFMIPWVINQGAGLTAGAYDLAEWTTLHPASRAQSPPLLTGLLLRLQPLLILNILLLNIPYKSRSRWLAGSLLTLLLCLALLPPLEFLSSAEDLNYRQQLGLSIATLITGFINVQSLLKRLQTVLIPLLLLAGIVAAVAGLSQTITYMQQYGLIAQPGPGGLGLTITYVIWLLLYLRRLFVTYSPCLKAGASAVNSDA